MAEKKTDNNFKKAFKERLDKALSKNPNILLELKKSKEAAIAASDEYVSILNSQDNIEELTEDQLEEKLDAWGKCLNNILYYDEVNFEIDKDLKEVEHFINIFMRRQK